MSDDLSERIVVHHPATGGEFTHTRGWLQSVGHDLGWRVGPAPDKDSTPGDTPRSRARSEKKD